MGSFWPRVLYFLPASITATLFPLVFSCPRPHHLRSRSPSEGQTSSTQTASSYVTPLCAADVRIRSRFHMMSELSGEAEGMLGKVGMSGAIPVLSGVWGGERREIWWLFVCPWRNVEMLLCSCSPRWLLQQPNQLLCRCRDIFDCLIRTWRHHIDFCNYRVYW